MTEKTLLEAYLCGMRIGYRMSCLEDARMLRQEAEKEMAQMLNDERRKRLEQSGSQPEEASPETKPHECECNESAELERRMIGLDVKPETIERLRLHGLLK